MNLWNRLFRKTNEKISETQTNVARQTPPVRSGVEHYVDIGIAVRVSDAEKELVSVLCAAILTDNRSDTTFILKDVVRIDEQREIVALIAAALAAELSAESTWRIRRIEELSV